MNTLSLNNTVTMTSLEIAELTGKEHFIVMRDIKAMLEELGGASSFGCSYISEQNKELPCFKLPKRECLILISGYDIKMRFAIIKRWQVLEEQSKTIPHSPELNNYQHLAGAMEAAEAVSKSFNLCPSAKLVLAKRMLQDNAPAMIQFLPVYVIGHMEMELDRQRGYQS